MSVDPASWQPGTIISRDGEMTELIRRDEDGWAIEDNPVAQVWCWLSDVELADSWQPLADVVARGWEQRQEVPEQWCLTHAATKWASKRECSSRYFGGNQGEPCRLVSLSYPITEGNNE